MTSLSDTYAAKKRYWATRRRVMKNLIANGWSVERIAEKYKITRQAVYSTLKNGSPYD